MKIDFLLKHLFLLVCMLTVILFTSIASAAASFLFIYCATWIVFWGEARMLPGGETFFLLLIFYVIGMTGSIWMYLYKKL